jgi:hypothetical protein
MDKTTHVYPDGSAHTEKPNKFHDEASSIGLCVKVSVDGHTFIIHGTDIVIEGSSLNSHLKQYPITLQKVNRCLADLKTRVEELEKRKGGD